MIPRHSRIRPLTDRPEPNQARSGCEPCGYCETTGIETLRDPFLNRTLHAGYVIDDPKPLVFIWPP